MEAIRYGSRAGARAIRHSVNMALGIRIHFFKLAYTSEYALVKTGD